MIVLHAKLPIEPDRMDEARELAADLVEQSNREAGMIDYRATVDITDEHTLRFFEQYEDEAALAAHNESDHFQAFEAKLPDLLGGEPEVLQFEVADVTELDL